MLKISWTEHRTESQWWSRSPDLLCYSPTNPYWNLQKNKGHWWQ